VFCFWKHCRFDQPVSWFLKGLQEIIISMRIGAGSDLKKVSVKKRLSDLSSMLAGNRICLPVIASGALLAACLLLFAAFSQSTEGWSGGPLVVLSVLFSITGGVLVWSARKGKVLAGQLEEAEAALTDARALAQHDPLTGLPNRRHIEMVFPSMVHMMEPDQFRAVIMMDIDGFKPVNDVYGHSFGDLLLKEFAGRLNEVVGEGGLVARLGGDEFAIVTGILAHKDAAAGIARRVLNRVQEPFLIGARQVTVGSGIGIAVFPDNGYSIVELLRRADVALYRAKTSGRSTFRFFETEMDAAILHRTLLEQRLRGAIASNQISPYFQPIWNLRSERIAGFEALARWTDRDFGKVPPSHFIPIAEDCGLMPELTDHLLTRSCQAALQWPEDVYLSFNLSPVQLHDRMLPLRILTILGNTGFPPERLEIEITENALIKDPRTAREILGQLSEAGMRIALDDFGTGHSSLRYLRDFRVDRIKIDRSFVAGLGDDGENGESAAIVRAILGLAAGLGIEAIAEGIEEQEQKLQLSREGCNFGQGFLFSQAITAEEAYALVCANVARQPDADALPDQ
jgi:diguanylate cyclase (GGDEF)-like protein